MGSGGPRGLQILLSVADRGRGGFDSHTFPPLAFAVALLVLLAGAAHAQPAPVTVSADSTVGERHRPWHERPTWIMARSAVVPGWGQLKNGRPLKAGIIMGVEGFTAYKLVDAWKDVDDALARENEALAAGDEVRAAAARSDYEEAYSRRATAGWLLVAEVALSMLDAYVDAHLIQFDADFGPDPSLPADDTSSAIPGSPGARLSLNLKF